MTKLVVENCDRFGRPVELFEVVELYDINGCRTQNKDIAVSMVVHDGTCHHVLDPDHFPIRTVH